MTCKLWFASSLVCLFARGVAAQNQAPAPRIAASSFATVEVHINARPIGKRWYAEDAALTGPAKISISYGQPHARGRKVEGGLIPLDTVWRFGANEASHLHTDLDITLGTIKLPRGDYSLFVLNGKTGWELIVNSATAMWGTDRNPAKDIGRIALEARVLAEPEETLSVYLTPEARAGAEDAELRGTLHIKWGKTVLGTTWKVDQ